MSMPKYQFIRDLASTKLYNLIPDLHHIILDLRCLERLLQTQRFKDLYPRLTAAEQHDLLSLMTQTSLERFRRKYRILSLKYRGPRTFRELRDFAQTQGVMGYSRMSKEELVQALEHMKGNENGI